MIFPVKVWSRKGLRQLLRHDMAKSMSRADVLKDYQKHYELSDNERRLFDAISTTEYVETTQPWTYKRRHCKPRLNRYEITCVFCGKKGMRTTRASKYCSDACYRTYYSRKQYSNQKGDQNEAERREI